MIILASYGVSFLIKLNDYTEDDEDEKDDYICESNNVFTFIAIRTRTTPQRKPFFHDVFTFIANITRTTQQRKQYIYFVLFIIIIIPTTKEPIMITSMITQEDWRVTDK